MSQRFVLSLILCTAFAACDTAPSAVAPRPLEFAPNGDSALIPGASHAGWWQAATNAVALAEYEYSSGSRGEWIAPNRAQGLRSTVTSRGLRVVPRNVEFLAGAPAWVLDLSVGGLGRVGHPTALSSPTITAQAATVTLDRGVLVEHLINAAEGIEQVFEISAAPRGSADLRIALHVSGDLAPVVGDGGQTVLFRDAANTPRLYYRALHVTDANGATLSARFVDDITGFGIRVEDQGAAYPIIVDPLITGPVWTSFMAPDVRFGTTLGAAGDLNSDGFPDIWVSAPAFDDGVPNSGKIFVFFGSPTGPSFQPGWTASLLEPQGYAGNAAGVGDVNGDGHDDFLLADSSHSTLLGIEVGNAHLWYGGPSLPPAGGTPSNSAWSVSSASEGFGRSVAGGRDITGDGAPDFVVGSPLFDNSRGRVRVFAGGPGGPVELAALEGATAGDSFGSVVDLSGDFDGDGLNDVLVGPLDIGGAAQVEVAVYAGAPGGPSNPVFIASFPNLPDRLRHAFAAGDVDGNGQTDLGLDWRLASGAYRTEVLLLNGTTPGSQPAIQWELPPDGNPDLHVRSEGLGDVNGDGFDDFAVAHGTLSEQLPFQGRLDLFLGSAEPQSTPARTLFGPWVDAFLGVIARVGDVNLDGYDDMLVGAPGYDGTGTGPPPASAAFLFYGGADPSGQQADWDFESDQPLAALGTRVWLADSLNGDAYGDLVTSAPMFPVNAASRGRVFAFHGQPFGLPGSPSATLDESQQSIQGFGRALEVAGDIDSDGKADLLIDGSLGPASLKRRVELRTANLSAPNPGLIVFLGPANDATFGTDLFGLGDLNGDGHDDFAIAKPGDNNDSGLVRLYHGTATAFMPPMSLSPAVATLVASQPGEQFGAAVASADIDADGRLDLLVGAPGWDSPTHPDQGRVAIYLNSATGLSSQPDHYVTSNNALGFGKRLLGRLDLDGNAFDDVAISLEGVVSGEPASGGVRLLIGGGGVPSVSPLIIQLGSGTAGWRQGDALANAGDLDGDGFDDVLIGIPGATQSHPQEGALLVVSGWGISQLLPQFILRYQTGGLPLMRFGTSVAGGVDVDGNGTPDIAVGAPGYTNGEASEGAVFLYLTPAP